MSVTIINGGTQGLGEAVARRLVAAGSSGLVLAGRSRDRGDALAAELTDLGTPTVYVVADMLDPGAPGAIVDACDRRFGVVNGLVNVAALTTRATLFTDTPDHFDRPFAVGGNKEASRQVGVPAARTKTQLFMLVAGAAWLVGMLLAFRLNTIQANTGDGLEFQYIIAAVVGGTLLTGGYGSAFGGAIGALIIAMATLGIPNARWNSDWRFLFLGVILLLAVIANRSIRTRAESMRR